VEPSGPVQACNGTALPLSLHMYITKNSYEIVQERNNIQISKYNRMITLDIKDLYVNLPVENILHITKFWLET